MRRPRATVILVAAVAIVLVAAPLAWSAFFSQAGSDANSLTAAAAFDGYAAVVTADNPAGYWRLSEASGTAASDASGNGNGGTYTNGPALGQAGGLLDDSNSAVRFDGTDDEVRVAHAASLNLGDAFTLEAWIKRDSSTSAGSVLEKGAAYELGFDTDGRLTLRRGSGGDIAESTRKVTDTRWHHVVATKNGSTARLYLDGADVTGRVSSITLADNSDTLTIGSSPSFTGTLDEVAVYATALSADRVAAHAHAGRPYHGEVKSDSPGAYWRLGEASGTSELAFDSQNANHASYLSGPARGAADALLLDTDPAVQLDGTDDYLKAADSASLDLGNTFTLEAWIKRDAISSGLHTIFHKESGAYILRILSDNRLSLRKSLTADVVASTATITDTTNWHHVAVTKSGSTVRLYLDGADVTGTVSDQTFTDNSLPLWIGRDGPGSPRFAGSIDDAAVYPTALSLARIQAHFEAGRPYREEVRADAPVSWWRMADGAMPLDYLGVRGAYYSSGSGYSLPINRPAEVVPGDVMVAAIHESGGTSCTLTAPSGWTLLRSQTLETLTRTTVFWRLAGTSEPSSYTWTSSCLAEHAGAIIAYANADGTTPIDASASQENAASLSVTCPAVTTTRAGAALIAFPFTHDGTAFNFPSAMTERFDMRTGTSAAARTMAGGTEALGPAGSTGTRTVTNANPYGHTTPTNACVTVAVRPMLATLHDHQHANDGTWSGGPTFQSTGAITGDDDPAATLDGTSAHATVPSSATLNLGDGPFSLEAWVKLATSTSNGTILDKGTGAYRLTVSGNRLSLERPGTGTIAQSTNTIADTAWHHVVATKSAGSVKLYVDGSDVTGTVTNSTMTNNSTSLTIGGSTFLPGSLDEVAIYNKVLSASDVMRHHRTGRG